MKLIELIKSYNQEMDAKRMMGKVCLAYGLSRSEDAKRAWKSYDEHLQRCIELRKRIENYSE